MPKILIADDSIAVRKVAERLLTEAGLGVTLAANGEEALAYLTKERPDVVVSDVIMPDKSGYEVCAFIRGNATLASTPVLLISGIVNDEVTRQADCCRADGVLKKPFQGTSLKDRVLELIAKRQDPAPAAVAGPVAGPAAVPAPTPAEKMMSDQPLLSQSQDAGRLKEMEEQLREERARFEELTKRLSESTERLARAKEGEAQLASERKRADGLQARLNTVEQHLSRIPELESALKAKQDAVSANKHESEAQLASERKRADGLQATLNTVEQHLSRISELESALKAEQNAVSAFKQESEAQLASERKRADDLQATLATVEQHLSRIPELESALKAKQDA